MPASENLQIQEEIKTQAKPQIDKVVAVSYTIDKVKTYGDIWAMIEITSPSTDPANVVLKNENGA